MQLRSKKALIEAFLKSINVDSDINGDWKKFVDRKKEDDFQQILIEEGLGEQKAQVIAEMNPIFKAIADMETGRCKNYCPWEGGCNTRNDSNTQNMVIDI